MWHRVATQQKWWNRCNLRANVESLQTFAVLGQQVEQRRPVLKACMASVLAVNARLGEWEKVGAIFAYVKAELSEVKTPRLALFLRSIQIQQCRDTTVGIAPLSTRMNRSQDTTVPRPTQSRLDPTSWLQSVQPRHKVLRLVPVETFARLHRRELVLHGVLANCVFLSPQCFLLVCSEASQLISCVT